MYEHSIKVPRHYKVAANIYKKACTEGASVKTLLYDDKLRHYRTNVLYALIMQTIKHAADIDKMFVTYRVFESEPRLDPWLAKILTTELLFGKRDLPGLSKPVQTILSFKKDFERFILNHHQLLQTGDIRRPRYVRVNTNMYDISAMINYFQKEGFRFLTCTGSYNDFLQMIREFRDTDFMRDYHVKNMFVFSHKMKFHDHPLYLENKIVLQDKATAMAVQLLDPGEDSIILDMCAAPGMKTTQMSSHFRNKGRIIAVERDNERFRTLCDFIKKTNSYCVSPVHRDALSIEKDEMPEVTHILLDPSCSGSGLEYNLHDYLDTDRLEKLSSLQEKFLKHAMNAFPNARRIIYSTCSLFPEENERVVANAVKASKVKWRVRDVKELLNGQWNNFGSAMYGTIGPRCMYARPESDLTRGFFLAVIERDKRQYERLVMKRQLEVQQKERKIERELTRKEKLEKRAQLRAEARVLAQIEQNKTKEERKQISDEQNKKRGQDIQENVFQKEEVKKGFEPASKKLKVNRNNFPFTEKLYTAEVEPAPKSETLAANVPKRKTITIAPQGYPKIGLYIPDVRTLTDNRNLKKILPKDPEPEPIHFGVAADRAKAKILEEYRAEFELLTKPDQFKRDEDEVEAKSSKKKSNEDIFKASAEEWEVVQKPEKESQSAKKKKNKKADKEVSQVDEIEGIIECRTVTEIVTSKSKKKSSKDDSAFVEGEANETQELETKTKKSKNKKRDKDVSKENSMEESHGNAVEECETPSTSGTKKSKSKKADKEVVETETFEFEETEVKEKKKKKKKSKSNE